MQHGNINLLLRQYLFNDRDIIAIDPGYHNMGLAVSDSQGNSYMQVDLNLHNNKIPRKKMARYNPKETASMINSLLNDYWLLDKNCLYIIEEQPGAYLTGYHGETTRSLSFALASYLAAKEIEFIYLRIDICKKALDIPVFKKREDNKKVSLNLLNNFVAEYKLTTYLNNIRHIIISHDSADAFILMFYFYFALIKDTWLTNITKVPQLLDLLILLFQIPSTVTQLNVNDTMKIATILMLPYDHPMILDPITNPLTMNWYQDRAQTVIKKTTIKSIKKQESLIGGVQMQMKVDVEKENMQNL